MKSKKGDMSLFLVFALALLGIFMILYFHLCGNLLWTAIISAALSLIAGLILFSQIHYAGFIVSPFVFVFLMVASWIMQNFALCGKFF